MRRFVDWFFRDSRDGRIVIGQWPNLPLWLFLGAGALAWALAALVPDRPDWIVSGLRLIAGAGLAWWAIDEVARGVNPWRRCLGVATLLVMSASLLSR